MLVSRGLRPLPFPVAWLVLLCGIWGSGGAHAATVLFPAVRCPGLSGAESSSVDAAVRTAARAVVGADLSPSRPVLPVRCGDDDACVESLRENASAGLVVIVRCRGRPGYFRAELRAFAADGSVVGVAGRKLAQPPDVDLWRLLVLEVLSPERAVGTVAFQGVTPSVQLLVDGLVLSAHERAHGVSLSAGEHRYQAIVDGDVRGEGVVDVRPGESLVVEDATKDPTDALRRELEVDTGEVAPKSAAPSVAVLASLGAVTGVLGAGLAVGEGLFGDDRYPEARSLSFQIAGVSGGISLVATASASVLWLRQQAAQQEVP